MNENFHNSIQQWKLSRRTTKNAGMENIKIYQTKHCQYLLILVSVAILFLAKSSFARGSSHTSSGGDFIRNPTTDAAIDAFLNNPNQWAQLVWLQKTIIDDLQYLIKTDLIYSKNNFFLAQIGQDKQEILRQLRAVSSQKALDKLMLLFKNGEYGTIGELVIPVTTNSCNSNGRRVSASIKFNDRKKSYTVCVDYVALKKNTDQETFHLHLVSLLSHELVHVWNDDFLDPKSPQYQSQKEILPKYFQGLILKYFSYAHHLNARNSIHKMYNWVAETYGIFRSFKESWDSALEVAQPNRMAIHDAKINFLCKSYLRDAVFPSEVIYNIDVIRKMFLQQGLIEVPMAAFSRLTNALRYMTLLKYYCYINISENPNLENSVQKPYFKTLANNEEINMRMLPPNYPVAVTIADISDQASFKQILELFLGELNYVYMSQKSIPALMQ